jgi:hypothetical protein
MSLTTAKPILIEAFLEIFTTESDATESPEESRQRIAEKLASAIDKFVRAGSVQVSVTTTGTATAQIGTGTGNII